MPLGHKYISRKRNASGGYDYVYPHPTTGERVRIRTSLRLDGEHRSVTAENPEDRTMSATAWSRRGADGKTLTEAHSALDEAEAPIHRAAVADTMNRKKTITRLSHKTSSYGEKHGIGPDDKGGSAVRDAARKAAWAASEPPTGGHTRETHEKAAKAHEHAAKLEREAGRRDGYVRHASMAEQHRNAMERLGSSESDSPVYPFWVRNQRTGVSEGFKTREQADTHLRHYVKNPEDHIIEQVGAKGPKVNVDHLLSGNMGIPRIEMPQIRSFKLPEFLSKLEKKGIKATKGERAVGSLKPTQNEIHGERVQEIIEDPKERENLAKQIIISNDGFILDGHHRWAALTTIDPKAKIKTLHVDMPMRSLLKEAHAFEGVEYQKSEQETDMGGDLIDNLELLAKGDTLVGFYSPGVARGGKYYRRVPTGNPKHPWRYFYTEAEYKDAMKDASHVGGTEAKRARVKKRVFVSEKEAREKYGLPGTTKELHAPDGNYPPERKKLHEEIISHFLDGKGKPPAGKKPVALLTVGGPAAGKSTLLKHLGENLDDYVMIAADDVKEKLPEFQRALNLGNRKVTQPDGSVTSVPVTASHSGWMAHDESTDISDELEKRVIASGKSAIFDGTGKNVPKMLAKIAALKKAGYHVRVVMPHVPMGEAIKRLHSRSEDTGRTLPVDAAIDMHRKIPGNFEAIARAADDFSLFKSGNPPKPIWTGGAGQEDKIHDHEEMSKFNLARGLHQDIGAEEKAGGIYKKSEDPEALDATGPKQPHHTMNEFMEILSRWNGSIDNHEDGRSKVPHDGDIEDGLADVIPDAEDETVKHLKRRAPKAKKAKGARFMERGEVEKSGDLIDSLEALVKGGEAAGHKLVHSENPRAHGGDVTKSDRSRRLEEKIMSDEMQKGLYQFQGLGSGEVPDQYLYDYLCAFVEEAYEHERQEKVHQNTLVPPSSTGASIEDVWATAVFNELVSMMGSNANLKRAAVKYNVTKDVIAHILRSKGLVRPFSDAGTWTSDYDSMRAMDGEGVTRPLVLSESARAQYRDIVPDPFGHNVGVALAKAEPAPTAPLFIDDSHDPHGNLAKAERARLALVDYRQNAEWRPNVSPTCMIHGSADLTKSMNLSNPHARCTCPR
jgi:hypothetical protein